MKSVVMVLLALVCGLVACGDNNGVELQVSPGAVTVPIGRSVAVEVTEVGAVKLGLEGMDWQVEDASIASASARGGTVMVTGRALGKTRAVGNYYGVAVGVDVEVTEAVVDGLRLSQASMSVPKGMVVGLHAVAVYSDGSERDVTREASWSLDDDIASISVADATLHGDRVGATTGHVVFGGVDAAFALAVTDAQLMSLEVDPPVATIPVGVSIGVTAIGHFSDDSTLDISAGVTWSSNSAVAELGTGSVRGMAVGSAQITATLGAIAAHANITVTSAAVTSLSISPAAVNVPMGTASQLTATATFSDGHSFDVSSQAVWHAPGVAVSVDDSGRVLGLVVGQSDVTAEFGGKTAHADVHVTAALLLGLQVAPATVALPKGTSASVTATALWSDGSSTDVTTTASWSTSAPSVATVAAGNISGVAVGSATITATFGLAVATTSVTVNGAALGLIAIDPPAPSLAAGTQLPLTATGTYSDNSTATITEAVTWSSNAPLVVSVSNVPGSKGKLLGLLPGTAKITASLDGATAEVTVTVTSATLTLISVEPTVLVIANGLSFQATAKATYSDGSTLDVTNQATWDSTLPGFASVSPTGSITAHSVGATVVSARIGATFGVVAVTVSAAVLDSLQINPQTASLPKGTGTKLTATGVFSDGSHADLSANVTWSSSASSVASVTNGLGGGQVQANAPGSATITATLGGTSASATVTVGNAQLLSIEVVGAPGLLPIGLVQDLKAFGTFSDGTVLDVTALATWDATGTGVVVSNANGTKGRVTGIALGQATVSATIGSVSGELTISTSLALLLSITVSDAPAIPLGTSAQLIATGHFSDGSDVDLTLSASWSSSAPATLSVANGLVTANTAGSATIEARVGLIAGTRTLSTSSATLTSILISPATASIAAGISTNLTAQGHYSDGSTLDLTGQVIWSSSGPAATVSMAPAGKLTAVSAGSATITAKLGAMTGSAFITVTAAVLQSVTISGTNGPLALGQIVGYSAVAQFSDGSQLDVTSQATWSATGTLAVSNATPGRTTATGVGNGDVSATFSGMTGTKSLSVSATGCHLVINEVKTGGLILSQDEFVELYNPCDFEIDISRGRLSYRIVLGLIDITLLDLGGSMPGGSYRLYGGQSFIGLSDGSFAIDLAQVGGSVVLRYNGTRVDSLGWGTGLGDLIEGLVAVVLPPSKSLARVPNGQDTNNNRNDFVVSTPTPRAANN